MPKFCGNCGSQMDDSARVCGNCGTPFAGEFVNNGVANQPISGVTAMSEDKKKKLTMIGVIAGAGVVAIIIFIIAISCISSFSGYKGTLNKYFNAIEDYDVDTLVEITSDTSYVSEYYDDMDKEEVVENYAASSLDWLEEEVGDNVKIKYKIEDASEISERDFDDFIETLEDDYDYDTSEISKIMEVELEISVKGEDDKTTDTGTMYLIKEDGKWYYYDGFLLY